MKEASGESRLYHPEDIQALLKKAGFIDISLHGGMNGEPCTADHQRCITLARVPT